MHGTHTHTHTGDIFEPVGSVVGSLKNCKVGDGVVEIGDESSSNSNGGRIVLEAKRQKRYSLKQALEEIRLARSNRGAQVCTIDHVSVYGVA